MKAPSLKRKKFIRKNQYLLDVLMKALSCPAVKTNGDRRLHAIAKGNDDVEIIMSNIMRLCFPLYSSMLSGSSEFPNNHCLV